MKISDKGLGLIKRFEGLDTNYQNQVYESNGKSIRFNGEAVWPLDRCRTNAFWGHWDTLALSLRLRSRNHSGGDVNQSGINEKLRVPSPGRTDHEEHNARRCRWGEESASIPNLEEYAGKMHKPKCQFLPSVWRARHIYLPRMGGLRRVSGLVVSKWLRGPPLYRPYPEQRPIFSEQLSLGNSSGAIQKYEPKCHRRIWRGENDIGRGLKTGGDIVNHIYQAAQGWFVGNCRAHSPAPERPSALFAFGRAS